MTETAPRLAIHQRQDGHWVLTVMFDTLEEAQAAAKDVRANHAPTARGADA